MPNSPTRASLPAAAPGPEYAADDATLTNNTANSAINAAPTPDFGTRQSHSRASPTHKPSAASAMLGCGPESPSGIGSGGSNSAVANKSSSQRPGLRNVHQLS